jgi:hypothetical protein
MKGMIQTVADASTAQLLETMPIGARKLKPTEQVAFDAVRRYLENDEGDGTFSFRRIYRVHCRPQNLVPDFSQHDFKALAKGGFMIRIDADCSNDHVVYRLT